MEKSKNVSRVLRIPKNYTDERLFRKFSSLISCHFGNVLNFEFISDSIVECISMKEVYKFGNDVYILEIARNSKKNYYLIKYGSFEPIGDLRFQCMSRDPFDSDLLKLQLPTSSINIDSSGISYKNSKEMVSIPIGKIIADANSFNGSLHFIKNADPNSNINTDMEFIPMKVPRPAFSDKWINGYSLIEEEYINSDIMKLFLENKLHYINFKIDITPIVIDDTILICIKVCRNDCICRLPSFACISIKFESEKDYDNSLITDRLLYYNEEKLLVISIRAILISSINQLMY